MKRRKKASKRSSLRFTAPRHESTAQTVPRPIATSRNSSDSTLSRLLRHYRVPLILSLFAIPLAVYEGTHDDLPDSTSEVRAEWLMPEEVNLPSTLLALYPQRSRGHMYRAYQASMCFESRFEPQVCDQFANRSLEDVRQEWLLALQSGEKVQEEAMRNFAFVLYQMGETKEAARVISYWRSNFPYSSRPDPRDVTSRTP